jgi:DNA-binding winged helix-turn-helix (wHTH) protein/tetratricopeptide (TPR) repeat protein
MHPQGSGSYEFGPFRIDPEERMLFGQGQIVPLSPKSFDLLFALVRRAGRVVGKEELMREVWPDTFVEENNLTVNISALRKALGEVSSEQLYIHTVPRRGYRFTASVRQTGESAPGAPARAAAVQTCSDILVGRDPDLSKLEGFLRQALEGAGRTIFITGEAGIGKSALAEEFMRLAPRRRPGLMLARGRALEQYGAGEAYLPFLDALSGLLRDLGDAARTTLRAHAPTWCLQLPVFRSSSELDQLCRETAGATKNRILREMGDALGALSESAPLVLLLEDLHWADPSTIDLLRYLRHRISTQRVLLLATFRPEDLQVGNHPLKNCKVEMQAHHECDEIVLGVLGAHEIANLLEKRFQPNEFPDELASVIHRRTDGQPLFTVSLLEFLARHGEILNTNSHWRLARPLGAMDLKIPDDVRALIRKKSEALDPSDRRALQYASVEGEEFFSTVLAKLLDCDHLQVEEQLAALAQNHRLIEPRGEEELPDGILTTRYRFAHALYQNVFYDELVSARRTLLHSRAGEQLLAHYGDCAPRIAVQLAMHFERGRNWERAIEFLIHAGANATSRQANRQAEEDYTHALSLADKLPPASRAEAEFRIFERRAAVYLVMSRFELSIADCKQTIERARAIGSLALECAALYALGNTLFFSHRLHELRAVLDDVLELAKRTGSEEGHLQALALMTQGHLALGELTEAENKFQQVIERPSQVDPRTLLGVLDVRARLRMFQSEYSTAEKLFRETMSLASELGDAFETLKSHYFLTLTLANLGRISEALEVLNRAMEMARRNGDSHWASRVPNCLGWIHRELQDFEGALAHDRNGVEIGRSMGVLEAEVNSVINLAIDHFHAGDRRQTDSSMQAAESLLAQDHLLRWRFEMRFLAARAEQTLSRSDALALLGKATHHCARKYMADAHRMLAQIAMAEGDPAAAEAELNSAIQILREFPAPLAAWKTHLAMGRMQAQLGRREAAQAAFGEAASVIRYIAGNVTDERLRQIFLSSAMVREALLALE